MSYLGCSTTNQGLPAPFCSQVRPLEAPTLYLAGIVDMYLTVAWVHSMYSKILSSQKWTDNVRSSPHPFFRNISCERPRDGEWVGVDSDTNFWSYRERFRSWIWLRLVDMSFKAPIIALYANIMTTVPVYIAGGLVLSAGCLALLLPYETRGKASM